MHPCVHRRSTNPKYRQIYDRLAHDLSSGSYAPGQKLPSEAALVRQFGPSRITVGRAVRELKEQGFVKRFLPPTFPLNPIPCSAWPPSPMVRSNRCWTIFAPTPLFVSTTAPPDGLCRGCWRWEIKFRAISESWALMMWNMPSFSPCP